MKAFDSLSMIAFIELMDSLQKTLPIRLRYAFLKELFSERTVDFSFEGFTTNKVHMEKGIRQGACDSSMLFALIIAMVLGKLEVRCKAKGYGICFGKFGGNSFAFYDFFDAHFGHFLELDIQDLHICALAFIDDLYLLCKNPREAQCMLDDLIHELTRLGLSINLDKSSWMCDKWSWTDWGNCKINFGCNVWKTPVDFLKVLGSISSFDGSEIAAIKHRISKAWGCFHKWQHILLATGTLQAKITFWLKTVWRSLNWGLQTTRKNEYLTSLLSTTQKLMFRKMLRLKRHPIFGNDDVKVGLEPWLQWQIRSMTRAGDEAKKHNVEMSKLMDLERHAWAGRVARLGFDGTPHLAKYLVAWRSRFWWETQKWYNSLGWDPLKHAYPFKPARWEDHLPINWLMQFVNEGPTGQLI